MKKIPFISPVTRFNHLYQTYGKYQPIVFFIGGFLWDSITLTRIDRLSDNLVLLAYLFMLGFSIILVNRVESGLIRNQFVLKYRKWYPLAIQFFLGGLFSSYVVFYFQSASVTKNWLFLGILIILLFANEFLEKRLTNIYLQLTLYFLACFAFFNFFIPVIVKKMNFFIFILSGILSVAIISIFLRQFFYTWSIIKGNETLRISAIILSLFLLINIAYFKNWIPPVPLSHRQIAGLCTWATTTASRPRTSACRRNDFIGGIARWLRSSVISDRPEAQRATALPTLGGIRPNAPMASLLLRMAFKSRYPPSPFPRPSPCARKVRRPARLRMTGS